jgi:hypothetical protein
MRNLKSTPALSFTWVVVCICLTLFIPTNIVNADMAPVEKWDFNFIYHSDKVRIIEGKLRFCRDLECSEYFDEDGDCKENHCIFPGNKGFGIWDDPEHPPDAGRGILWSQYKKLIITFEDKIRESNVFESDYFSEDYRIYVGQDSLSVSRQKPLSTRFPEVAAAVTGIALFYTILIETIVAVAFFIYKKIVKSFLGVILLVNILSIPIVWLFFPRWLPGVWPGISLTEFLIIVETFAFVFEAGIMALVGRKHGMTIQRSFMLSFLMNAASYLIGWFFL